MYDSNWVGLQLPVIETGDSIYNFSLHGDASSTRPFRSFTAPGAGGSGNDTALTGFDVELMRGPTHP